MRSKKNVLKFLMLLAITVLGVMYSPDQKAFAAETAAKICAVSYTDESILVFNNSNTKIYYATESDASKGNWDVINVGSEPITVIDISWLSPNKENILMIKGDVDPTQQRVIINKRPQKLEVSINYSLMGDPTLTDATGIGSLLNIMATEGTGIYPITFHHLQWKKGDNGHWMSTDTLTKGLLKSYLIKGAYIYFRIAPVDDVVTASKDLSKSAYLYAYTKPDFGGDAFGTITFGKDYPDGTKGNRASNEVKLKITKQTSLPITGIDGGDFAIRIKYGQEYRVTIKNGTTPTTWTQVTDRSVKSLPLKTMVNNSSYDGLTNSTAFPELLIEIRDYATSKAAASKIVETHLEAQRQLSNTIILGPVPAATSIPDPNIYVAYNGTKNITVTIPTASKDTPYEYCVVKPGQTIGVAKMSWTTITKSTAVKIMSSKAVDFGTLYVRMKEIKYKKATKTSNAIDYKLASTYQTYSIKYPAVPVVTKMTHIYTKGYPTEIKITATLNVVGKEPFETSLKYIKLGTKDVPITSAKVNYDVTGKLDENKVYIMEIILNSKELETMTNCTARALSIYYGNNFVDKTSTKLTIKNPTAAPSLTAKPAKAQVTSGATAVTIINPPGTGNSFVYTIDPTEVKGKNKEDTIAGNTFTSGMEIAVPVGQYLTIYEINTNTTGNIVRYKSIQITSDFIKQ